MGRIPSPIPGDHSGQGGSQNHRRIEHQTKGGNHQKGQQEPAFHKKEENADHQCRTRGDNAHPKGLIQGQPAFRHQAAAAAEGRAPGIQINPAFVIKIIINGVDTAMGQHQTDTGQHRVPQIDGAMIPGNGGPEKSPVQWKASKTGAGFP